MAKYPRPSRYLIHDDVDKKRGIHFEPIVERRKPGRSLGWLLLALFAVAYLIFHLLTIGR